MGRALRGAGGEGSAFASFEWYETWWRHYSAGASLNLVTGWQEGELIGVAPLMLRQVTIHGLPATALCFMENNQSLNNDFIVLPAVRESFLAETLRHCFAQSESWDVLVFKNLPESSPNREILEYLLERGGRKWLKTETWFDSPYLIPSGTWEEYLAGRTTRTRKSLRNIRNSIEKAGAVSVRQIRTRDEFLEVKDEVFEVARLSWAGSSGDPLSSASGEGFLEDLALAAAEKGWLSVWTLQLDGRMIAIEFHLRACGKEHAMRGHYLPEYARLSPGTYLEMQILQHVFEEPEKLRVYDFCGSFENYKRKWTDSFVPHSDITIFGDSIYSRLIRLHECVTVPLLKRALPQDFWNNRFFRMCGINTKRMGSR